VKNPLQFLTIGADGMPGEVRGILDKEPTRRFNVYAKVTTNVKKCWHRFYVLYTHVANLFSLICSILVGVSKKG